MIKSLSQFTILILVFSFQACNDEPKKTAIKTIDNISNITDTVTAGDVGEEYEEPDDDPAYVFPKNGQRAEDFITEPDVFEIQYEAKGDLNSDGLADIAFVRKEKKVSLETEQWSYFCKTRIKPIVWTKHQIL